MAAIVNGSLGVPVLSGFSLEDCAVSASFSMPSSWRVYVILFHDNYTVDLLTSLNQLVREANAKAQTFTDIRTVRYLRFL